MGQRIGWARQQWTLTSSTLERYMQLVGKGFEMVSPDGNISTTRLLEMFVDDTYKLCNTSDHDTIL